MFLFFWQSEPQRSYKHGSYSNKGVYGEGWQSVSGSASNRLRSNGQESHSLVGRTDWTLNKRAAGQNRTDGRTNQIGGACE